jgi:hypothetical protein
MDAVNVGKYKGDQIYNVRLHLDFHPVILIRIQSKNKQLSKYAN